MSLVQKVDAFFDKVWCNVSDEMVVRDIFKSTEVEPKRYFPRGLAWLIKTDGKDADSFFDDDLINKVVGKLRLDDGEEV